MAKAKKKVEPPKPVAKVLPERTQKVNYTEVRARAYQNLQTPDNPIPHRVVDAVLKAYHEAVISYIEDKDVAQITLPEGVFKFSRVKERIGCDARTGEKRSYPECERLNFKVSATLR